MAACIASYKRVEDLLRQILCMMNQSYPHLHVFAAVKGVSAETARRILLPHVQPFIDAGRVTLRLCPNRNQLTNFMDTVRGLDISSYDLLPRLTMMTSMTRTTSGMLPIFMPCCPMVIQAATVGRACG